MSIELPDTTKAQLPAVIAKNRRTVERGFWKKLMKFAGRIPFSEDAAAAYFCAIDPTTPSRVKGLLLAALAYFVVPTDAIPDFVAGLGFSDDAAVLAMAVSIVSSQIKPEHRRRAREALHLPPLKD